MQKTRFVSQLKAAARMAGRSLQGTVSPYVNFNAEQDSNVLRAAMKGAGNLCLSIAFSDIIFFTILIVCSIINCFFLSFALLFLNVRLSHN